MKNSHLEKLRDRNLDRLTFRKEAALLGEEIAKAHSNIKDPILIPILRAGLALLPPFLNYFPNAPVGFIGIKRDEKTAKPSLYYINLPELQENTQVLLLDPMLATGGSANLAIEKIKSHGAKKVHLITMIAAKPGIDRVKKNHPDVPIFSIAIDEKLDAQNYIVPGLGDFGDRFFGTMHT